MADANFIESCSACRFFLAPNGAIGVCRRYPTHQNRHGNDWCGEWTYKLTIEEITEKSLEIIKPVIDDYIDTVKTIKKRGRKRLKDLSE